MWESGERNKKIILQKWIKTVTIKWFLKITYPAAQDTVLSEESYFPHSAVGCQSTLIVPNLCFPTVESCSNSPAEDSQQCHQHFHRNRVKCHSLPNRSRSIKFNISSWGQIRYTCSTRIKNAYQSSLSPEMVTIRITQIQQSQGVHSGAPNSTLILHQMNRKQNAQKLYYCTIAVSHRRNMLIFYLSYEGLMSLQNIYLL